MRKGFRSRIFVMEFRSRIYVKEFRSRFSVLYVFFSTSLSPIVSEMAPIQGFSYVRNRLRPFSELEKFSLTFFDLNSLT